ncbi:MAG: AMP-binding protein [Thermoguttaceae bacterium]|jgi:amino acid adenylation domain-containing protein|nr:AMP-binding protein [Thermoguttaceae bacterium]
MLLHSFLEQSATRSPDKTALVCDGQRMSYAELELFANRLGHALRTYGVRRGDRVAIHLDNSAAAVVALFAVLKADAAFVPVNPTTKTQKLAYVLNNCRARVLVLPEEKLASHRACFAETPHLETLVAVGGQGVTASSRVGEPGRDAPGTTHPAVDGSDVGKRCVGLDELLDEFHLCAGPPPRRNIDVDLAALVYTSGSTGDAKGVMLTHRNMVAAATSITTYLENTPDDVILSVLPLSFDYGLYQVLMSVNLGGTMVLERSFAYPHAVMRKAVAERVTGLPLVPTMLAMLLQMDVGRYALDNLRYVTNTGAAMPVDHISRFRKLLPHVKVFSMYGLTECKRVAYLPPAEIDRRPGSVGKAMPNTEAYPADDDGRHCGPGEVGELVVRGSNVMAGYWENPEATDRVLRPGPVPGERMLYTGDLFRTDDDGYLYFVGRKDDIIKSRGEKVSPREVENALCTHPGVAEAAVLGMPDPILGQAIAAFVALRPGCEATERELLRHCAARLEDFMVPKAVTLCDALPKTANQKIDKRALAENANVGS